MRRNEQEQQIESLKESIVQSHRAMESLKQSIAEIESKLHKCVSQTEHAEKEETRQSGRGQ